jgi:hypothetical protein
MSCPWAVTGKAAKASSAIPKNLQTERLSAAKKTGRIMDAWLLLVAFLGIGCPEAVAIPSRIMMLYNGPCVPKV